MEHFTNCNDFILQIVLVLFYFKILFSVDDPVKFMARDEETHFDPFLI